MSVKVDINAGQSKVSVSTERAAKVAEKFEAPFSSSGSRFLADREETAWAVTSFDRVSWWNIFPMPLLFGGQISMPEHVSNDMLWVTYLSLDRKSAESFETENKVLFKFEKFQILLELAYREIKSSIAVKGTFYSDIPRTQNDDSEYIKLQNSIASKYLQSASGLLEQLVLEMNDYFSEFDSKQRLVTDNFVDYGRNPVMYMAGLVRSLAFLSNVTHDEAFFQRTIEKVHLLIYYLIGSPNSNDVFEAKRILADFEAHISLENRALILEAIGRTIVKHNREAILREISERLSERGAPPEEIRLLMAGEAESLDRIIKNAKDRVTGLNNLIVNDTALAVYSPAIDCELPLKETGEGLKLPRLPALHPQIRRIGAVPQPREAIYYFARANVNHFVGAICELREGFKMVRAQMVEKVEKR